MRRFTFSIVLFCLLWASLSSAQEGIVPLKPVNHARVTIETSVNGNYAFVALPWSFAFPDTNYTATCAPEATDTQLWFFQFIRLHRRPS